MNRRGLVIGVISIAAVAAGYLISRTYELKKEDKLIELEMVEELTKREDEQEVE